MSRSNRFVEPAGITSTYKRSGWNSSFRDSNVFDQRVQAWLVANTAWESSTKESRRSVKRCKCFARTITEPICCLSSASTETKLGTTQKIKTPTL